MSDNEHNIPYRQTRAYVIACERAAWQNAAQRAAAKPAIAHWHNGPWHIPRVEEVTCSTILPIPNHLSPIDKEIERYLNSGPKRQRND